MRTIWLLVLLFASGCSVTLSAFVEHQPSPIERQRIEVTVVQGERR